MILRESLKEELDSLNENQLSKIAELVEVLKARAQDFIKVSPFWQRATPAERAKDFREWAQGLPKTQISLSNEAFNREKHLRIVAKYLLDTNVILRFSNPSDAQHAIAVEAVTILLTQENECYLSPQVLIELWVVATRPTDVNGLGWSTGYTRKVIDDLLERFPIADDSAQIFGEWLELVTAQDIKGKRTHDMRIVALMRTIKIDHILTLNPSDFSGVSDIIVVTPQDIIQSAEEERPS